MQVGFVKPVFDRNYRYYYARFRFQAAQSRKGFLLLGARQFAVAWINGVFLGRTYIRSHEKDILQEKFDLGPHLREGENVVALLLHSWDVAEEVLPGVEHDVPVCFACGGGVGDVDFSDLSRWRVHPAEEFVPARRHNSLLGHEEFRDTRLEPCGWREPGYDDSQWRAPAVEDRAGWDPVPAVLKHLKEELVSPDRIVLQGRFSDGVARKILPPGKDSRWWRIRFSLREARSVTFFFGCGVNSRLFVDGSEKKFPVNPPFPWIELYQPVVLDLARGEHVISGMHGTVEGKGELSSLRFGWRGAMPDGGDRLEWAAEQHGHYSVGGESLEDPEGMPLTATIDQLQKARLGDGGTIDIEARHEDYAVVLEFPKSIAMLPRLEIADSSPGAEIDLIYSERLSDVPGLMLPAAYTDRMLTRGGSQTYEVGFAYKSARILIVVLRARGGFVKLRRIQAVFRHYDYEMAAEFSCNDRKLNSIWEMCRHTMLHGSQDVIVDGVWREQLLYIGDNYVHNQACYHLFANHEIVEWQHLLYTNGQMDDGLFHPTQPCMSPPEEYRLLDQVILWPIQLEHHLRYTGREKFVLKLLPAVVRLLDGFQERFGDAANGDPRLRGLTGWKWVDHPGIMQDGSVRSIRHDGIPTAINCLYILALDSAIRLLSLAGNDDDATHYRRLVNQLRRLLSVEHWDESRMVYSDCVVDGSPSQEVSLHVNLLAILAGIADEPSALLTRTWKQPGVLQMLGPYFRIYLFEVLHRLGRCGELLDEIREVWGGYLDAGLTTTPEYHPVNGEWGSSVGHPWGASPVIYLTKSIIGIEPLTPGWTTISLDPHLAGLKEVNATVPAPLGPVKVQLKSSGETVVGEVEVPVGMEVVFIDEAVSAHITVRSSD